MASRRRIVIIVAVILTLLSVSAITAYALTDSKQDNEKVSQSENTKVAIYTNAGDFQRKLKALSVQETTQVITTAVTQATIELQPQSTTTCMAIKNETQDSTTCEALLKEATTEVRNELTKFAEKKTKRVVTTTTSKIATKPKTTTKVITTTKPETSTTQLVTSIKETTTTKKQSTLEEIKLKYINTISYDMDVTVLSGFTLEEFKTLMEGITLDDENDFFKVNAESIYNFCNQYQINEIFFCGIISAESWWGTADNCIEKNNFTGMMGSSGLRRYETIDQNLEATAQNLHNNYLSPGGSFNNGTTISGVSVCYCGPEWPPLVWERMSQILN